MAQLGLLFGGFVAGVLVLAANPLQRRLERIGEPRRPSGPKPTRRTPESVLGKDRESAYRDAVRLALRDRRFEPYEEIALANLADRLGLTAMRAIEIRLAVEKERGLR